MALPPETTPPGRQVRALTGGSWTNARLQRPLHQSHQCSQIQTASSMSVIMCWASSTMAQADTAGSTVQGPAGQVQQGYEEGVLCLQGDREVQAVFFYETFYWFFSITVHLFVSKT
jgi:hypothetical protein